ncbi:YqeG family HAD IIIA-type phosphatase [Gloeocapsa sp. PCC 73106]|uniref:YqeG family HAD IIIA-type phosphatase n=1 Tax=Gloeocapsa sp. PCC 73106 TaxID=102232 RepID=UPI0002AD1B37|nr:YqeG family HAD IIIA-type phosphatase [Gloeocapsa sp. PCC 73106]ELR98876.1 HAD phosphatase subfamily IIIA [Gloeocapsa sp. PCC 73106]
MINKGLLRPNLVLEGSILRLDAKIIDKYQLKGLILDVDDTLVPLQGTDVSPEILTWLETIRDKVVIWLVSNNLSRNRISRIANTLDLPYLFGAVKPSRRKLKQVLDIMNLKPEEVAMVGDRFFTDVLAGNRLGMFTILVEPISHPHSKPNPFYLRNLEVLFLQLLGLSFPGAEQNLTKQDKSS